MGKRSLKSIFRFPQSLLWALLFVFALPASAEETGSTHTPLPEFELRFDLQHDGILAGRAVVRLSHRADGSWQYTRSSETAGVVSLFRSDAVEETSYWHYHEGRIRPDEYVYRRTGNHSRRLEIEFDWQQGTARNILEERAWRMKIPDQTLDKLSVELALMQDLRELTSKPKIGDRWDYSVADGGHLKQFHFKLQRKEKLQSPIGTIETVVFIRSRKHDKQQTRYWLASGLGYLPVRIERLREGTETALMHLTDLEVRSTN